MNDLLSSEERGGCPTLDGSYGSGTVQPTSEGIRSRCMDQAATTNSDMYDPPMDEGATSKMRHYKPMTCCATSSDQTWVGILVMARRTLKYRGEKRVPCLHYQRCNTKVRLEEGGGKCSILSASLLSTKMRRKLLALYRCT
jgi:hypothetical protein